MGSNPTLSARYTRRPERGVLRIWRREVGAEATRVRRIRRERIRTAEWLALGRLRTRVRCMYAPHNPTREIRRSRRPERGVLRIWRREVGAEATRVRRIRQERIRTPEWLALERAARKGWVRGWTQQSGFKVSVGLSAANRLSKLGPDIADGRGLGEGALMSSAFGLWPV